VKLWKKLVGQERY